MPDLPSGPLRWWIRAMDADYRLSLPADVTAAGPLQIGAVGHGWCELTDDPTRHALIASTRSSRNRLELTHLSIQVSFGPAAPRTLLAVRGQPGAMDVLVADPGVLTRHLGRLLREERTRVSGLWQQPAWVSPWAEDLAEGAIDGR